MIRSATRPAPRIAKSLLQISIQRWRKIRVFELALGPGADRRRLRQDRRGREDFAADRVECPGRPANQDFGVGRCGLLLRVLRRDQRLQLVDQLRARFIVFQRRDELLQLLDRRRARLGLAARRFALRAEQRQEAERQESDPR